MGTKYGRLTSDTSYETGTEYGGVDGMIQPPPHDPATSARNTLKLIYQTNPAANWPAGLNLETQPIPVTEQIQP